MPSAIWPILLLRSWYSANSLASGYLVPNLFKTSSSTFGEPFSVFSKVISGYFSLSLSEVCCLDAGLKFVTLVFNCLPVFSDHLSVDIGGKVFWSESSNSERLAFKSLTKA